MPRRALAEKRPFLLAAIAVALAFYGLRLSQFPELWLIPLKGLSVALLALYVIARHKHGDARILTAMLAFAAVGQMLLEIDWQVAIVLFYAYNLAGLTLYLRHRRPRMTRSQKLAGGALLLLAPLAGYLLGRDTGVALYMLSAGAMAGAAWTSAFPRYQAGIGAVLLLASDFTLLAGQSLLAGNGVVQALVWPLAFLGHLLVATGVVQNLRRRHATR